eukprot:2285927-Rhodomonas_salina.1
MMDITQAFILANWADLPEGIGKVYISPPPGVEEEDARGASTSRSPSGSKSAGSSMLALKSQYGLDLRAAAMARTSLCPPTSTTCSVRAHPSRTSSASSRTSTRHSTALTTARRRTTSVARSF